MTSTTSPTRLRSLLAALIAAIIGFAVQPGIADIKVNVNFDKTFDFKQARTWSWNPNGAGQVVVGRTKDDDPETVRQRAEPVILDEVSKQLPRRGLKPATGAGDLTLTYYVLLTVGQSSQTLGQFLPSVAAWGLPPFPASTTSLEVIEQGSLVIDQAGVRSKEAGGASARRCPRPPAAISAQVVAPDPSVLARTSCLDQRRLGDARPGDALTAGRALPGLERWNRHRLPRFG
jgi:hypothetical protein